MTSTRHTRVFALFDQVIERPASERSAFLDEACAGDAELRREVEAMLRADEAGLALFDASPATLASAMGESPDAFASVAGRMIGPYRIVDELGSGGMGAVYRAERADVGSQVALKLVRGAFGAPEAVERFLVERRILARLEHPNVARLLDAGVAPDGTPWFAMERVEGEALTSYAERHRLTIPERLRLFMQVCEAVAYIHRNLIVHRDLKPSNILVTTDGQAKLLDFGIAKLLAERDAGDALTRTGARPMTPEYAAPEQLRGDAITTATDVYSLGAILYELLTGQRPHPFRGASLAEIERVVLTTDPPRPSVAVNDASPVSLGAGARSLRRRLTGDLDHIVMRALAKDPARRYPSVEALLADVGAHLEGRPIAARPDSWAYRARKFVRRNAVGVSVAAAFALVLTGFAGVYTVRVTRERERTEAAGQTARKVADFLKDFIRSADPTDAQGRSITAVELLDRAYRRINTELADEPEVRAELLELMSHVYLELGRYGDAVDASGTSLELVRSLGASADERVSSAAEQLGAALRYSGREEEAVVVLQEAIERERARGRERRDSELAALLTTHAAASWDLGRFETSRQSSLEAIEIKRRLFGEHGSSTLTTKNNFGLLLLDAGDYEEAERLYRENHAVRLRAGGPLQTQTISATRNLGRALGENGRLEEAEQIEREAVAASRQVYAAGHPRIAWALHELGVILLQRGKYDAAFVELSAALDAYRAALTPEARRTARVQTALARASSATGRHVEARRLLREAFEAYDSLGLSDHYEVGELLHAEGEVHERSGDENAAEKAYVRAEALQRRRLGDDHPRLALTLHSLARLLSTSDVVRAREYVAAAARIQRCRLREGHPDRRATEATAHRLGAMVATEVACR